MNKANIKKIIRSILLVSLLGIFINKMPAGLAISDIPTALTPEEEIQLLPKCENFEFPRNLYPSYFNLQVECLQLILKQNLTIYPEGLVTGFYGRLTRAAVTRLNQIIEGPSAVNNPFFDHNARQALNSTTGTSRIDFIKNLTQIGTTTTSRTTLPTIVSTTKTSPVKVIPTPTTTTLIIHPASAVTNNKSNILSPWWKDLNIWIDKISSLFKKTVPTTSPKDTGTELDSLQTTKMPQLFAKILAGLSRVKIFNTALIKSADKEIVAFTLPAFSSSGIINQTNHTITIQVPYGTDVRTLKPHITLSPKASIIPQSEQVTNYTQPVAYTVTAENKSTVNYVVTVTEAPKSSENTITEFKVKEYDSSTIIDNQFNAITLALPLETDLTNLTVILSAAPYAETDLKSGTSLNLKNLKNITVTAQNGNSRIYSVRVIKQSLVATTTTLITAPPTTQILNTTTTLPIPTTIPVTTTGTTVTTKPIIQGETTVSSTTSTVTTSPVQTSTVSTSTTTLPALTTTATTSITSTTTTTKANTTIIVDNNFTSSSTTSTTTVTISNLATTISTVASNPKTPFTPTAISVLKNTVLADLKDFLSASWVAILIGFAIASVLGLAFVLLKTGILSQILEVKTIGSKFISGSLNNSQGKVNVDQRKRLIILTLPLGEQVLAKDLILTRDPNSRLVLTPKPEEVVKDGTNYILMSLEGDQIIYTVKIKQS